MIAELGHFALIMALGIAIVQTIFPIAGAARGNPVWMSLARPAAQLHLVFMVIAFSALTYTFLVNDFSVILVAQHSNTLLPTIYRISAVWGNHEGSLLLWAFTLAIWTTAVSLFSRHLPDYFVARVIGVMGSVSIGFLLFLLLTSNPFGRQFPAPVEGADLNPLLQDPGLIIHPPMLYMGYVGFSVAFGFAIAALLGGHLDTAWARWSRPWTIMAWVFLTAGIALGSWWAYYELGWGGWWFWDPVENASFMPWLVGTALIHSLAATDKREVFKNWTVLLAICAFTLSLLGTFLVRSGVLTSVHAFATDPTRGIFILCLLGFFVGTSLVLYAWRAPSTLTGGRFRPFSRETFLLLNSVLLLVATFTVLMGTIYPLIIEAFGLGKLSVGAPYFNAVFIPLMLPVVAIMGIGANTHWKQDDWRRLWHQLRFFLAGSLVLGSLMGIMLVDNKYIQTITGIVVALWILFTSLSVFYEFLRQRQDKLTALRHAPLGFYGMTLAHIGIAITIVGITVTTQHSVDLHKRMVAGEQVEFAGHVFLLEAIRTIRGPNYTAAEAVVKVSKDNKHITTLRSQKRTYFAREMPMTEAGIDWGMTRDLYVSLGEPLGDGAWSLRLYHKPFVRWIWFGAIFMTLGGLLSTADRRYRIEDAKRSHGQADASLAGAAVNR